MRISVIIPSRVQANPNDPTGGLWLERALASVRRQEGIPPVELEVVVGLDPGMSLPSRVEGVRAVNARRASQAAAINAAVAASRGEFLAFLEDDDAWEPRRLGCGLARVDRHDLVTTNQTEVTGAGEVVQVNDFPTPSGWLMRRSTWDEIGPFDEGLVFHVDNEYLGRVNAAGKSRLHLVEAGAMPRPWLANVARFTAVERTGEREPLVIRTVNPEGGMGQIGRLAWAKRQSDLEYGRIRSRYGCVPL